MKKFELWLDESGNFNRDDQKVKRGHNPSLIGGLLFQGDFDSKVVDKIICEEVSHANKQGEDIIFEHFKNIYDYANKLRERNQYIRFVVFENKECIMVVDNNRTYQNIMAEGIMQLITELKTEYGEIHLKILIANRVDTSKNNEIIPLEDYESRLEERSIMAGLHNSIERNEWEIKLASARKDKRLMIADNICNCYLKRNTAFGKEKYSLIRDVYENAEWTIKLHVLQESLRKQFDELMIDSRLGEAISIICQCENEEMIQECMVYVAKRVEKLPDNELWMQYCFMKALLEHYLNVTNAYGQCEMVIKNTIHYFIPILEKKSPKIAIKVSFDLHFYLLTVYTHQGNISAGMDCEKICDEKIKQLPAEWNTISLGIKYDTRRIVNKINRFDFENALKENENVIEQCRTVKEILSLHLPDIKFDELGKALGTQVQIYTFLIRHKQKNDYDAAAKVSDEAIAEFINQADINRQYLYRTQLETEAGHYDRALEFLFKYGNIEGENSLDLIKTRLEEDQHLYLVCAFVKLMAEGSIKKWERADELFAQIQKTEIIKGLLEQNISDLQHPTEIILWKYASYFANTGQWKASINYFEKAIDICFANDNLTLNMIGLAVLLEQYAVILENNSKEKLRYKKKVQKHYEKLCQNKLPESMELIYCDLSFDKDDKEYYLNLSKKITY